MFPDSRTYVSSHGCDAHSEVVLLSFLSFSALSHAALLLYAYTSFHILFYKLHFLLIPLRFPYNCLFFTFKHRLFFLYRYIDSVLFKTIPFLPFPIQRKGWESTENIIAPKHFRYLLSLFIIFLLFCIMYSSYKFAH